MIKDSPYRDESVPICNSLNDLQNFLDLHRDYWLCLYLAYKDEAGWRKSTSPKYMNQSISSLIYLPVNIEKDDFESLREVYRIAQENERIIAINQTQPHKSNPILMELFKGRTDVPTNVDAIIKDDSGKLQPYDLNGPSFVGWFDDEIGSFENKTVILIGVGGVGEPIARRIVKDKPKKLILIDPSNKASLATELAEAGEVKWYVNLENAHLLENQNLIVLNAAGKEGVTDQSGVYELLEQFKVTNNIFVDIRPQLDIDIVEKAKALGWQAYTGYGMNARNDYTLLQRIAEQIEETPPSFDKFKELVMDAS